MIMTIRPDERAKVAVLVAGVVGVSLLILFQLRTFSGTRASITPANALTVTSGPSTPVTTSQGEPRLIKVPDMASAGAIDPFRTVLRPQGTTSSPPPTPMRIQNRPPAGFEARPFPPVGSLLPFQPKVDSVAGAAGNMSDLGLYVQGVIVGERSVAVIHFGPESLVLHKGERFGDGMSVISISESTVVIGKGKERIPLPVGGPRGSQ